MKGSANDRSGPEREKKRSRLEDDAAADDDEGSATGESSSSPSLEEGQTGAGVASRCFQYLVCRHSGCRLLRPHSTSSAKVASSNLSSYLRSLGFRIGKVDASSSTAYGTSGRCHSRLDVTSKSAAVSLYRDSLVVPSNDSHEEVDEGEESRLMWIVLLGAHPLQPEIEQWYSRTAFRDQWCCYLLLDRLLEAVSAANTYTTTTTSSLSSSSSSRWSSSSSSSSRSETSEHDCPDRPRENKERETSSSLNLPDLRARCLHSLMSQFQHHYCLPLPQHEEEASSGAARQEDPFSILLKGPEGELACHVLHRAVVPHLPSCTLHQLRTEHERIKASNATLSNAFLQLWQQQRTGNDPPSCNERLTGIEYHDSPNPKFQRFKLYSCVEESKCRREPAGHPDAEPPPLLVLLPCWGRILAHGIGATCQYLVDEFWDRMLDLCRYHPTAELRNCLSPHLHQFFASGLGRSPCSSSSLSLSSGEQQRSSRFSLQAGFCPEYPLSAYLHGPAGTGKSSFVRAFPRALESVLRRHADPALGRTDLVKQLLNKPLADLELELELRRNNNDRSLSSLLASRRNRNGLVVLALEELAPPTNNAGKEVGHHYGTIMIHHTDQLSTLQLLTERLSGWTGTRALQSRVRSDGTIRSGISADTSIVTLFTSNYGLTEASQRILLRDIRLFENLAVIRMSALKGLDRLEFATSYLHRYVDHQVRIRLGVSQRRDTKSFVSWPSPPPERCIAASFDLREFDLGSGDTRPLVRRLRMVAYYIAAQLPCEVRNAKSGVSVRNRNDRSQTMNLRIVQRRQQGQCLIQGGKSQEAMALPAGLMPNLLVPSDGLASSFSPRTSLVLESLRQNLRQNDFPLIELATLIEFWWTGTLSPAVVLSQDGKTIESLLTALSSIDGVHALPGIDVSSYRMMKSLYDPFDTPNLRDDIRRLGAETDVVVELRCRDGDSQLSIREMIEDTPSMAAYSSDRSALHKEGLLFLVHIDYDVITPEILSRASLII